ncbi:MAG: signal peptidase I [Deltaproteobacteria bacterium]|nr:signal peptidase I [Deltaproteobacteria bacterium]
MLEKLKEISANGEISTRKPVVAFLMSICPGLGQQYAGYLVRGIVLYFSIILISWLIAIAFMFVNSKAGVVLFAIPVITFFAIAFDAYRLAGKEDKNYRLQWFNRGWIYATVFLLLLFTVNPLIDILIGSTVTRASLTNTIAMEPAILKHDVLLINKLAYRLGEPKKDDIVSISYDEEAYKGLSKITGDHIIRRIVALPGDKVEVDGRDVLVNGKALKESYGYYDDKILPEANLMEDITFKLKVVPPDNYFVLGDNRSYSMDSRILGFIPKEKIVGKVTRVYWSWNFEASKGGTIKWDRVALPLK